MSVPTTAYNAMAEAFRFAVQAESFRRCAKRDPGSSRTWQLCISVAEADMRKALATVARTSKEARHLPAHLAQSAMSEAVLHAVRATACRDAAKLNTAEAQQWLGVARHETRKMEDALARVLVLS